MSTYIGLVFQLIMPFLYSTSSPKIITNGYGYSFFIYSIFSYSAV